MTQHSQEVEPMSAVERRRTGRLQHRPLKNLFGPHIAVLQVEWQERFFDFANKPNVRTVWCDAGPGDVVIDADGKSMTAQEDAPFADKAQAA